MDWFRQIFGLSRNYPKFEDDFGNDFWQHEMSFPPMFEEFERIFSHIDEGFRGSFKAPSGFGNMDEDARNFQNLRDSMLKVPDTKRSDSNNNGSSCEKSPCLKTPSDKMETLPFYEDFGNSFSDPFSMFENFFKFSFHLPGIFDNQAIDPFTPEDLPYSETDQSTRKDGDLDDGNIDKLLKEKPGYSFGSGESAPYQVQPHTNRTYKSTSIVRIRKPDGTIEETRKYTDSSGRQETVVTTVEPDAANVPSSSLHAAPPVYSPENGNYPRSVFSWLFGR